MGKTVKTNELVSIIIVTFNSEKYIFGCLKAIYQTQYYPWEVIVVDNHSSDNTIKIVENNFPKVKVIKNSANLGYAGGNNLGVKAAKGKYIAIINPDTQVSKNWLQPLLNVLDSQKVAICQPKIMLLQEKDLINCTGKETHFLGFEWLSNYEKEDYQMEVQQIMSFSGSIFLTDKDHFLKQGGFDENFFMYYEDGDLSLRIRLLGMQILMNPTSVAYHDYKYHPDEDYQKSKSKFYLLERNRLLMILKNYSTKTLILILPAAILMELGMSLYFFSRGWWTEKFKSYFWIIQNLSYILRERKIIQKSRKISDKVLSQNFKGKIEFKEFANPVLDYIVNPFLNIYWHLIKNLL